MALHELHPFNPTEIAKLPQKPGVYVLYQVQTPRHADSAEDLRNGLLTAKAKFPAATHFAVETLDSGRPALARRLRQLRQGTESGENRRIHRTRRTRVLKHDYLKV